MLDKGIIERIVLDYKDIYKQALEDNLQSPAELPYFEGDFWPNVLEENIRELEQVMNSRYSNERANTFFELLLESDVVNLPNIFMIHRKKQLAKRKWRSNKGLQLQKRQLMKEQTVKTPTLKLHRMEKTITLLVVST